MAIFLKGKVLDMNEYEINAQTLAIIPIGEEKSKVIEVNGDFIINASPIKIVDDSCKFFGSSYEGRFSGTKTLTGISHKSPIIVEESRRIIFFPTKSPRVSSCIWLSFNNIADYDGDGKDSIVRFSCGKTLHLHTSYAIIDNQVLRATRLESVLGRRMEKFARSI